MMHFPLFQISPISEHLTETMKKFPKIYTFSPISVHFLPISETLYFPLFFIHISLFSFNIRFLALFTLFLLLPYFDNNAYMHHALQVLNATPKIQSLPVILTKLRLRVNYA